MEDCSLPQDSLFLGFDCSTQSLKATVLDSNLTIVRSETVNYDLELPHYKTVGGVYRDPLVNGRIVSPPLMWVEALDLILEKLGNSNLEFGEIAAISGSAQQHGSVYWKKGGSQVLSSLDSKKPLVDQLCDAFSVQESPIWMDCSTTEQCRAIEEAVGGALELAKLTGSRAHERYVGPQVKKIFEEQSEVYDNTESISLVSSFMASVLVGGYACIDQTDGAGMNLMDIKSRVWSKIALEATAPGLEEKLGKIAPSHSVAGLIASYYVKKYHFNRNCVVVHWSGDNPNSLAGESSSSFHSWQPLTNCLSLHKFSHDSVFGITADYNPSLEGHVFPNPVDTRSYMVMLVYKNGSLTREGLGKSSILSCNKHHLRMVVSFVIYIGGKIGFYYKEHEILPPLPVGFHRYIVKGFNGDSPEEQEVEAFDPPSEARAIIEGQLLSMRAHAERFDSASLGAALRAAHGWLCNKNGTYVSISSMYTNKLEKTSLDSKLAALPGDPETFAKYTSLMKKRLEIENLLVQKFGRYCNRCMMHPPPSSKAMFVFIEFRLSFLEDPSTFLY
nr:xylulose kinase-like [Ipomoea trifida]